MEYKIGQMLVVDQDIEVRGALSGKKIVIPKGNKIIIGADKRAHHLRDGMIQPLGNAEVKGYDTKGLAEYLLIVLKAYFPLANMMLEDYGIEEKDLRDVIKDALDDIGF